MKYIYSVMLYIVAAVIFFYRGRIIKKSVGKHGTAVANLMSSAIFTIIMYATAVLIPNMTLSGIMYSLYYAFSDTMVIYMFAFSHEYTTMDRLPIKKWIIVIGSAAMADCISMLLNPIFGHVFLLRETDDLTGNRFFMPYGFSRGFGTFHWVFVYMMVLLSAAVLVIRTVTTPKIYREKYYSILVCLIAAVAGNIASMAISLPLDISLFFYGLVAFGIYFFTLSYTPVNLINNFLSHAVKGQNDAVVCYDIEGECIYANDAAKTMFGVEGDSFVQLNSYYKDVLMNKNIENDEKGQVWKDKKADKTGLRYYEIQYKYLNDNRDLHIGSVLNIHDETEEVTNFLAEQYKSTHDQLTGVANNAYFSECVANTLKTARSGEYCMICSNVKDFKLINDTFGIQIGDRILMRIAMQIHRFMTDRTVCGRLSGDKFAVFMPMDRYNEEMLYEGLDMLTNMEEIPNYSLCIHLGIYNIVDPTMPVSLICDRANMAIKSIKGNYTSSIAYYDEKLRMDYINTQKYTGDFNTAIDEKQFCIYLQPQMSKDGEVVGAEALVRWIHPERGLIPPGEFIEVFERTGLIFKLDMYIWEEACKQLRAWKDEGRTDCSISVNISPKDFYFTNVYETITKLIEKYDLDPRMLKLEITETAIMSDFKKQMAMINHLRGYGFEVEMDDFGSGYSSLNMLKDITVDTLKIDMGFLRATNNTEKCRAILRMIISLSRQLEMSVITEGVETKDQLDFLSNAGCDVFQGYYFSKPIPVKEFEDRYMESWKDRSEL